MNSSVLGLMTARNKPRQNTPDEVEVVASTFDEQSSRHVQVCDMVIEKSRRMVEFGEHVVILMDSLTRMARAYNTEMPHSGKILTGGWQPCNETFMRDDGEVILKPAFRQHFAIDVRDFAHG